jgi:hypothetical protein
MSSSAKWAIAVIVGIIGLVFLVMGVVYATVPIHQLPSFMYGAHPGGGTYHRRGAVTGLIGVVLLVIAAAVGLNARRQVGGTNVRGTQQA